MPMRYFSGQNIVLIFQRKTRNSIMIMTTTNNLEGKEINQYLGIITGEAILGANIFKDFFAGIRDIVGGRSAS